MAELLFLSHRIPYPPNKGDKIRSYHILRHLAQRHRVHLGSFIDDPADAAHEAALDPWLSSRHYARLHPRRARLRSLRGLLSGEPLSLPYYRDPGMQDWVRRLRRERPLDAVIVYSSAVAQYVSGPDWTGLVRVIDFVDVDSDKWRQYAEAGRGPLAWVYAREARRLLTWERQVAASFDASLFVAEAEARLFRALAPESADRVLAMDNGVDLKYFDPAHGAANPYPDTAPTVVFTGAMDYWANVDAVVWFADEVWPLVREVCPQARFAIVGANPAEAVLALDQRAGILVTGRVPDVRPYLAHARIAVAPLRLARGVQNKVLEALAMARPVVVTPAAAAGLRQPWSTAMTLADEPADLAAALLPALRQPAGTPLAEARYWVQSRYDWDAHLGLLDGLLPAPDAAAKEVTA